MKPPSLPARVLWYIVAVAIVSGVAFAIAVARVDFSLSTHLLGASVLLGAMISVTRFAPLPLGQHARLVTDTAPLVAAALLLPPPVAILTAVIGAGAYELFSRGRWFQLTFNVSEAALRVGAGAGVFRLIAHGQEPVDLSAERLLTGVLCAALTMYLLNGLLMDGVLSLQRGRFSPRDMIRRHRNDGPPEAALVSLGVLAALLSSLLPWTIVLFVIPVLAIYRAFRASLVAQETLDHRARHDALTGLVNRAAFTEMTNEALTLARRRTQPVALLFLDLDGFKSINDTLGHTIGDQLLTELGWRFSAKAPAGVVVSRFGGDEFTFLAPGRSVEEGLALAEQMLDLAAQPVMVEGHELRVGASAGVAWTADGTASAEDLLRDADIAMYHAKAEGKGRCTAFDPAMDAAVRERVELERELRVALETEALRVYYQPKIDLVTGRLIATEALARWPHPVHGMIPPNRFIPLAEDSGLVVPLGRWVLREACRQTRHWQQWLAGIDAAAGLELPPLMISVNLSVRQLSDPGLVEDVAAILAETELPPDSLILEVTESAMIDDAEHALTVLNALKALGVHLALDDFGTGYSSLSYLHRFPFDMLKIDKAFVDPLGESEREGALAQVIIAMGQTLGLHTIAEGIERNEQASVLRQWGCAYGQGYLFSRPLPPAELEPLLMASEVRARNHLSSVA